MPRALISGISGQDGAYLASLLLARGYEVHGTTRNIASAFSGNLAVVGVADRVTLHESYLDKAQEVRNLVTSVAPDEIYHLAAQSSVALSFQHPAATIASAVVPTIHLLEAVRCERPRTRFYHSSSSEMFGGDVERPCTERDLLHPRSPYAVGKASAHWTVASYRESYGLFACSGILFNHESPLRNSTFVTRKISFTVARIAAGTERQLRLGGLHIARDWGYAPEYADAMWRILQQDTPHDLVIATGDAHTLEEFVAMAFQFVGLDWREYTVSDPALIRINEVRCSVGDPRHAEEVIGWKAKTRLPRLIEIMMEHDVRRVSALQTRAAGKTK